MIRRPSEPGALAAATVWALGTWAALGTVALTGNGTSARIGILPPIWLLLALVLGACGLVFLLRIDTSRAAPMWLAAAAWLPWIPGPIPAAFLIFDGPIGVAVCLVSAGVVAIQAIRRAIPRLPVSPSAQARAAGLIALCLYGLAAWRIAPVIPGGDEPHYLIITQSLLSDGDLRIENNHARRDYLAYVDGDLKPDYLRRGRDGAIYSIHAPGLAVLVLPAFALAGYVGVTLFLAALSAAGGILVWRAAHGLTGDAAAAWVGWSAVALSAPFFFQAFTIYPDGPAAVLVLVVVSVLVEPRPLDRAMLLRSGAALAALPWLHTRYAALAGTLAAVMVARCVWPVIKDTNRWRPSHRVWDLMALLVLPALGAIGWLGLFHAIYGTIDPRAPYGGATDEHVSRIPVGLTGLLLDQQFGLLPNAPVYLVAAAGLTALLRRHRRLAIELVVMAAPYVLAVAGFHMWWAGHSSPARFLVPVLLPCALPVAAWWARHPTPTPRAATLLLLGISLVVTWLLAWQQRGAFLYNVRDGYALWLDWAAPAVNLAHALPSLFQSTVANPWLRAFGWAAALALSWWTLRSIEPRWAGSQGTWTFAVGCVACLTLLLGATASWLAGGRPTLEPGSSLLAYAAEQCDAQSLGRIAPVRFGRSASSAMVIPNAGRRERSAQSPLWTGRDVPPGRYTVVLRSGLNASGILTLALGRLDSTLTTCAFVDAAPGRSQCSFDLPAGATSLWLVPDAALRRTATDLELDFQLGANEAGCHLRAGRAVASSGGTLFVTGGNVYAESGGAWVIARSTGQFVVQTSAEPLRLSLRNGHSPNTVDLSSGDWHDVVSFAPNESHDVVVPRRNDEPAFVAVHPLSGFRPADVDPTSRDVRKLGIWIELR